MGGRFHGHLGEMHGCPSWRAAQQQAVCGCNHRPPPVRLRHPLLAGAPPHAQREIARRGIAHACSEPN